MIQILTSNFPDQVSPAPACLLNPIAMGIEIKRRKMFQRMIYLSAMSYWDLVLRSIPLVEFELTIWSSAQLNYLFSSKKKRPSVQIQPKGARCLEDFWGLITISVEFRKLTVSASKTWTLFFSQTHHLAALMCLSLLGTPRRAKRKIAKVPFKVGLICAFLCWSQALSFYLSRF